MKLSWIQNDSARKTTLKKRRQGLKKKVQELGILCDIPTCCVIYGPNDTAPETWPSEKTALMSVIKRYIKTPEIEKTKKTMNQDGFLRTQIDKFTELKKKIERENEEAKLNTLLYQCIGGKSMEDLGKEETQNLTNLVDCKLLILRKKIESMRDSTSPITGKPIKNFVPGESSDTNREVADGTSMAIDIYDQTNEVMCPPPPATPILQPPTNYQDWMDYYYFRNQK